MTTLLRSVRRVPLDGEPTEPVDVVLAFGRIAAIGTGVDEEGAAVEECDGRWISPGLWDEHTHFEQWAQTAGLARISGARRVDPQRRLSPLLEVRVLVP